MQKRSAKRQANILKPGSDRRHSPNRTLTQTSRFDIFKELPGSPEKGVPRHSSVAQWQSIRLLTEGL
jgi:hypothetical protein